jgi:50S ribosomal protein L16 3-hydroxylase
MFIGGSDRLGAASQRYVHAGSILPQRGRPSTGDVGSYNCTMSDAADRSLLGGLAPAAFLRRHWQKRALLVREAIRGSGGLVSRAELFRLACRDDVESRLVLREGGRWSLAHGPFRAADLTSLPSRRWTLLVQGVNLHLPAADALLRRFDFIPYARLDDLMVSYAAPGGGVGAHADSYDVFLLQGEGRRRWRISRQRDLSLKPASPLKLLANFHPDSEWTLGPGDMLYLPPDHAHEGVAIDACTTYSVGFRAASTQQLATAFLDWLRDEVALDGRYADPDLRPARAPARIGAAMQAQCADALGRIRWNRSATDVFLGCYLTEPKQTVYFTPPRRPLTPRAFAAAAARRGVRLDARTQLLYDGRWVFINGAAIARPRTGGPAIELLANARGMASGKPAMAAPAELLYRWYCDGYLHLG